MGLGAAPEPEKLWSLDYGIKMEDEFTIKATPFKKGCKYFFYDASKKLVSKLDGKTPLELTENSKLLVKKSKNILIQKTSITNLL